MEVTIEKEDLKDIDYIIDHFAAVFSGRDIPISGNISISALAFCLQSLIDARAKLNDTN